MSIIIFLITSSALTLYLYSIWLRYLAILPIVFLIWVFLYYYNKQLIQLKEDNFLQKYNLLIVRLLILWWLIWTLITVGVDINSSRWIIIVANFLLRIWSYFFDYEDGKEIFQYWLYISILSFLWYSAIKSDWMDSFLKICLNLSVLTSIMIWSMPIIISTKDKSDHWIYYKLLLSGLISISFIILNFIKNPHIAIITNIAILSITLYAIYHYWSRKTDKPIINNEEISLRRILAWERVSQQKVKIKKTWNQKLNQLLQDIPNFNKVWIELLNIFLLAIFILQYINSTSITEIYTKQIIYRITVCLVILNIILLKKIKYNSIIQNLILFIVVNFSIYFSLFSIFKENIWNIIIWWIIRNIVSSLLMFYIHNIKFIAKILNKIDYSYRIVCVILGMIINLILLAKTKLPGELIFFLFLLYLGIQSMILFYVIKFTGKIEFSDPESLII